MKAASGKRWALVARGALAVLAGGFLLFFPVKGLDFLVLVFGAFAILAGAVAVVASIRDALKKQPWLVLLLEGIAGIVAGAMVLAWPGASALIVTMLIGAWALVAGILAFADAFSARDTTDRWLLALTGVLAIVFGIAVMAAPEAGVFAVIWLLGLFAIAWGFLQFVIVATPRAPQRA